MKVRSTLFTVYAAAYFYGAFAGEVTPQDIVTFQNNTPAIAEEVNSNFSTLISAINDNDARLSELELSVTGGRTITVRDTGNPTTNGTNLLTAMASISGATFDTPWVIFLDPANYNIGSQSLTVKPWVGVIGRGLSRIFGNLNSSTSGVVVFTGVSALIDVWVENKGAGSTAIAIYMDAVVDVDNFAASITNTTAIAKNASTTIGIALRNSAVLLVSDSSVAAQGGLVATGIDIRSGSKIRLTDTTVNSGDATGTSTNCAIKILGGSSALAQGSRLNGPNENVGTGFSCAVSVSDNNSIFGGSGNTLYAQTKSVDVSNGGIVFLSGGFVSGSNNCTSSNCLCAGIIGDFGLLHGSCSQ